MIMDSIKNNRRIYSYKPTYEIDIESMPCGHKYIYDRGNGRKTAYLHYIDGVEVYEYCPEQWRGWKLMLRIEAVYKNGRVVDEKEVY